MMKFHLTLLRREGRRLRPEEVRPTRLVSTQVVHVKGARHVVATCCFGGLVVSELWEPELVAVGEEDITLRGFEQAQGAAVVQEWRLQPHGIPTTPMTTGE